jgi:hypothetical protein
MLLYFLMHWMQHRSLLPALPTSLALWFPRKEKNTMGVRMTTVLIFVVFWMILLTRRRWRDALLQDHVTRRRGRNLKGAAKLLVVDHQRSAKGAESVCCAKLIVKGWIVKRIIALNLHQATGDIVMRLIALNFHQPMPLPLFPTAAPIIMAIITTNMISTCLTMIPKHTFITPRIQQGLIFLDNPKLVNSEHTRY